MGYERFTYIQGMKTYKEYTIDKNLVRKYAKFVENKICEDVENQGINVSDLINGVFVMLFSDQYIPIPQIVSFDESYKNERRNISESKRRKKERKNNYSNNNVINCFVYYYFFTN